MFCGECGTQNPDTNQFCRNCGKPLKRPQPASAPPPAAAQPAPAQPAYYPPQQPVYAQQPVSMQQPPGTPAPVPATAKPPLNKTMLVLAIVGMLAGIGSFLRYPYILGTLAVVLGIVAIAKPENRRGVVMVIGILALLVGLGSMIFDMFYLMIMPPVPPAL